MRGIKAPPPVKAITSVTKTSGNPIKIFANNHGFSTNDKVFIANVLGATQANGGWTITRVDANGPEWRERHRCPGYASGTVYSFTSIPKSYIERFHLAGIAATF